MNKPDEVRFNREEATYKKQKSELLKLCEGKFVVFKGDEFGGVFDSPSSAYAAGIEHYGNSSFLIKQVLREERIEQMPALHLGLMYARS